MFLFPIMAVKLPTWLPGGALGRVGVPKLQTLSDRPGVQPYAALYCLWSLTPVRVTGEVFPEQVCDDGRHSRGRCD